MTQTYDANDVLMGGSNAPAWKFEEPGTTHIGTIASPPTARQEREYDRDNPGGGALKFFPSGDPIMGIVIDVKTDERDMMNADDDGKRTFYVEGRYIKEAVRNAVRAAGASKLEVGGILSVTFTHREDPMDKRSRKYWDVKYTPAAQASLMGNQGVAPTEQGPVNTGTGEIKPGPTPEQVAAVKAAGIDPASVFPGYTG